MATESLLIAKDGFVIACFFAQRISDLFRLKIKNTQKFDGGTYFSFKQYKMGLPAKILTHFHIDTIINKHKNNLPPNLPENGQSDRSILSTLI